MPEDAPLNIDESDVQKQAHRVRNILLVFLGVPYVLWVLWLGFLVSFLPHPSGGYTWLIQLGTASSWGGVILLLLLWFGFFFRVLQAKGATEQTRQYSVVRISLFCVPGVLIGAMVPFLIGGEPPLAMRITSPTEVNEFVAPVSVTFSVEDALQILQNRGLRARSFSWDFNADGTPDDETVVPTVQTLYERPGAKQVVMRINLQDGSTRRLVRRFSIAESVFKVNPLKPVVDRPVQFSMAHLLTEEITVKEIQWDFDNDGEIDTVSNEPEAVHIYYRTGLKVVSAAVTYSNQKQETLQRTIEIFEPDPLPFEVAIVSEPKQLISPAPFGTIWHVETDEPIREVEWDFGDGDTAKGTRVGHTFDRRGDYAVSVSVRSEEGEIATLSELVRVVDTLRIADLTYDGSHEVKDDTVTAEVPVALTLTPRTTLPLIQFSWEAPDATVDRTNNETLDVIYRRIGTYNVTLLAQDPDGKAARIPITVEVLPPSENVSIFMSPEGGTAPLSVRFDGSATSIPDEEISGFEWSFALADERNARGMQDVQQRGAQVEYFFREPGTYTVTLKARTTQGNVYEGSKTIVVRAPVLDACFIASRTEGAAPLGVKFDQSCTVGDVSSIEWDFGDGSQTDEVSPVHVFDRPGTFTVVLTLRDPTGAASTESLTITVTNP